MPRDETRRVLGIAFRTENFVEARLQNVYASWSNDPIVQHRTLVPNFVGGQKEIPFKLRIGAQRLLANEARLTKDGSMSRPFREH